MASIEQFEDHCWKDVVPAADMKLYSSYARETFVGPRPALLAIDLYNIVYRGGAKSPYALDPTYPNSCGPFAHQAIEPTKQRSPPHPPPRPPTLSYTHAPPPHH